MDPDYFVEKKLREKLRLIKGDEPQAKPVSMIYDIAPDGRLVGDGKDRELPAEVLAADSAGTVDWAAKQLFGGREEAVQLAESLVGAEGERSRWYEFCRQYREWERLWQKGMIEREPTLNDVCEVLKIDHREFFGWLAAGIGTMMQSVGKLKASLASGRVMDAAVEAAMDPVAGGKDRELVLKVAGVLEKEGGVQVNVNQQQGVLVGAREKERAKSPLLQFSETTVEIDEGVRERLEELDGEAG